MKIFEYVWFGHAAGAQQKTPWTNLSGTFSSIFSNTIGNQTSDSVPLLAAGIVN